MLLRNRSLLVGFVIMVLTGSSVVSSPFLHLSSQLGGSAKRFVAQQGIEPDFGMQIEPNQFLVKNGSSAIPQLVFTPLNGFAGNVTLSAAVYPMQPSAPAVSFNPARLWLNASLLGSASSQMVVSTTNRTESGLYNITVTGSSGPLSHSGTASVGVTSLSVPSNGAELLYKAHFTAIAYVGGSTVLENTFEDLGYISIGITNLTVSLDFGLYQYSHPPPYFYVCTGSPGPCDVPFVTIQPFTESTFDLTIQIPNDTIVGDHPFIATIIWILDPSGNQQSAPNLVAGNSLVVYSKPSNPTPDNATNTPNRFLSFLPATIGGLAIIVVLAVGLVFWNGKRHEKRNQAMLEYIASAKQSLTQKACPNCGVPAAFDAKFCRNCGQMIS